MTSRAFYRRAASYFTPDWPLIAVMLGIVAAQTALALLAAWPFAILVDSVLTATPRSSWIHAAFLAVLPDDRLGQVIGLAAMTLLMKLAADALSMANKIVTARVNYNGLMRVRCDLYRKLQALNLGYHKSQPQGDAIYRLTSDAWGCQNILHTALSVAVAAVTLVVMSAILFTRDVPLTLIAFSVAPFLFIVNLYFGNVLKSRGLACKEQDTLFTTNVQQSMQSISLVQAFGREEEEFGRFRGSIGNCVTAWFKLHWQEVWYWSIVGLILGIGGAAVFGYGGYLVYRDQFGPTPNPRGMTVGDLMVFTAYLGQLWGPLCKLTGASAELQGGAAGAHRVFEVLDRHITVADAPDAIDLPRQPRAVALNNISFAYPAADPNAPATPVLNDLSASFNPGEMVAFVGPSGAGKSTLLNLLPRFFDVSSGSITLDGTDIRHITLKSLRRHIALVLQESVILPTTVAENIAYGNPTATLDQIREAARLAGADTFIERFADGYNTRIAEGGANLSGGQRQRIAIARALLTQAPIIILDEPTSALDAQHEQHITDTLEAIKGHRTIVVVSHRLSTVVNCDRIFVLDEGRLVEQGTHTQLMAHEGLYANMARRQLLTGQETPTEPTPKTKSLTVA